MYSFTDEYPLTGANYYRFRITELSGRLIFSDIIKIVSQRYASMMLYPVPAQSYLTIHLADDTWIGKPASIHNVSGQMIKQFIINTGRKVYIQDIPAGIYFLKMPAGEPLKFIKN